MIQGQCWPNGIADIAPTTLQNLTQYWPNISKVDLKVAKNKKIQ